VSVGRLRIWLLRFGGGGDGRFGYARLVSLAERGERVHEPRFRRFEVGFARRQLLELHLEQINGFEEEVHHRAIDHDGPVASGVERGFGRVRDRDEVRQRGTRRCP
jgi:hypothetical protein